MALDYLILTCTTRSALIFHLDRTKLQFHFCEEHLATFSCLVIKLKWFVSLKRHWCVTLFIPWLLYIFSSIILFYWPPPSLSIKLLILYPHCGPQPLCCSAASWHFFFPFPSNVLNIVFTYLDWNQIWRQLKLPLENTSHFESFFAVVQNT